jgi:hypothetical protein
LHCRPTDKDIKKLFCSIGRNKALSRSWDWLRVFYFIVLYTLNTSKTTTRNERLLITSPALFEYLTTGTAYRKVIQANEPKCLNRKIE